MPITVAWADTNQQTLLVTYPQGWTWADYAVARAQMVKLAGSRTLDYINVYETGAFMPLQRGEAITNPDDLHIGFTVYVTLDSNIQRTLRYFQRVLSHREGEHFAFAPTIEAARRLLHLKHHPSGGTQPRPA